MIPFKRIRVLALLITFAVFISNPTFADDVYENYIKTSKDFKKVKQDKKWLLKAWPSFVYMPWYAKDWQVNYGWHDASGKFCKDNGYNGAFTDWGSNKYLDWINKFELKFYMDHTAGKGDVHLSRSRSPKAYDHKFRSQAGNRPRMINNAMTEKLKGIIKKNVNNVKSSPMRTAYSLDDEVSWGSFVAPTMWKITADTHYRAWLKEIYGGKPPAHPGWITYNALRKKLGGWSIGDFNCSQLMDQLSFNDSYWANYIGMLVEYTNTIDPATPTGFVGAQSPNTFGGYDYAKLMRKVQFLEAYGLDDTQSVARSFNPGNAIPVVSTHFHKKIPDTIWQTWYSTAHGNKGHIGWVAKWFDGKDKPKDWHAKVAPHYKEVGSKIGPLNSGSTWIDDKVAIYYSQASIQMSWIMDAVSHGSTWPKRNSDHARGTFHIVGRAWRKMLQDEGIQFNYINYVDVIQKGVPSKYKVLILPAIYCLSDAEARQIKIFVDNGGTLIADFLPGVFNQHGVGRKDGGALDEVFGIKQDPGLRQGQAFGDKLWVEVNQDATWSQAGKYKEFLTKGNTCKKDASGYNIAVPSMPINKVNKYGKGTAVFMNLSPQWYNAFRQSGGFKESKKRSTFMKHIHDAGVNRWVEIENAGEKEFGYEITYWEKGGKTHLFLCINPDSTKTALGGGNSTGLKTAKLEVTLKFAKALKNVKNERTGEALADGKTFKVSWQQPECVVLSFDGHPYK
ncbi:MAG: beta-galactosidase [Planctomycetota bacterium]|nr:MAG: beta-galactosidase [Planctomycetota bacterium]